MLTYEDVNCWLIRKIAEESNLPESEINISVSFKDFNLDSLSMVSLSYDLETFTGKTIEPTAFWEYDSIEKLSSWITSEAA